MTKTQPRCGQKSRRSAAFRWSVPALSRPNARAAVFTLFAPHRGADAALPGPKPAPPPSAWTGLMVSTYDESTDRAYANYPGGTSLERWNRALLAAAMDSEGFDPIPQEGAISTTKTGDNTPSRISRSTRSVHQKTLMTRGFHND